MKIEYNKLCANVLRQCPLPCYRCVFLNQRVCSRRKFYHLSCGIDGFEGDPGYIFKI
jgi:hypothetical protein